MKFEIKKIKLYNWIHHIMPKSYQKWVESYLVYSGIKIPPETYVGFTVLYAISLMYASVLLVLTRTIPPTYTFAFPFMVCGGFILAMHGILIVATDNRAKLVEELLPDALMLLAANIRSGLTIDKALLVSARPEFGPLEKEFRIAAKETLSGVTIENALFKISETFNSSILDRSVELLSEGLKRGGDLAKLLENLSDDIRQIKMLKKDVHAMVLMYAIFIFFAAGIGAPLLYSISGFLVKTMGEIGAAVGAEESLPTFTGRMPLAVPHLTQISAEFLDMYALLALSITSIFGGLLIGLVQEGSERAGLRFIPFVVFVSISVYFISKTLIEIAFAGITI